MSKLDRIHNFEFFQVLSVALGVLFLVLLVIFVSLYGSNENKGDLPVVLNDSNSSVVSGNPVVVIETSLGDIKVELYSDKAPVTAQNFLSYVNDGFYDGTVFHRVIDGFMVQGGGFTADGVQKSVKAPIKLESDNGLSNIVGTIAMARTMSANSATSQFFINVNDNLFLDYKDFENPGYAVFGRVVSGMDVVNAIKGVETHRRNGVYDDWPVEDVVIRKVYVLEN